MWQEIEIIIRNYIPDKLKVGMLFYSILNENTEKEKIDIWTLNEFVLNEEFFIKTSGYPVEILINLDDENVIDLQSLPLFDFDDIEHYYEMSLKEDGSSDIGLYWTKPSGDLDISL